MVAREMAIYQPDWVEYYVEEKACWDGTPPSFSPDLSKVTADNPDCHQR